MKLQAELDDKKHDIEFKLENGSVVASVDGRGYELEVSEPEPGVFLFKHEGRIYQAVVSTTAAGTSNVRIGRSDLEISVIDPKRLRAAGGGGDHADGVAEIKTAMPGKVVRVLVSQGDAVEKGDGIVVVEAMKMQNELKSPKAGVVKEIRAVDGATVAAGDVLARIE